MSGCRLSSAIREARIAFGNDLTGMESKHVTHVSIVVDTPINCCVRLLHLVPILLY